MTHGSLFSGIGGFDLAAEWMGWQNVFHCEWMPFPRKVLSHYWPEAISYHDITTTDFREHDGQIDILTGGFPCQPYSAAGKRLGKEDERHLWPHMLRAIREVSPRWVVGENVRGLTNWNGGVVFDEVQSDLESAGYEVLPFLLPAVAVNAPHRRDRIWFVAYADTFRLRDSFIIRSRQAKSYGGQKLYDVSKSGCLGIASNADLHGLQQRNSDNEEHASQGRQYAQRDTQQGYGYGDATDADYKERIGRCDSAQPERSADGQERQRMVGTASRYGEERDAADAATTRLQRPNECKQVFGELTRHGKPCNWQDFPTQSPICGRDDGLPAKLDGITFPKWRAESIKGYGNAIVPQVALQIFKAIEQYQRGHHAAHAPNIPHSKE